MALVARPAFEAPPSLLADCFTTCCACFVRLTCFFGDALLADGDSEEGREALEQHRHCTEEERDVYTHVSCMHACMHIALIIHLGATGKTPAVTRTVQGTSGANAEGAKVAAGPWACGTRGLGGSNPFGNPEGCGAGGTVQGSPTKAQELLWNPHELHEKQEATSRDERSVQKTIMIFHCHCYCNCCSCIVVLDTVYCAVLIRQRPRSPKPRSTAQWRHGGRQRRRRSRSGRRRKLLQGPRVLQQAGAWHVWAVATDP